MPKTLRVIFLGAGFSAPAGLPLGAELFQSVRDGITHEQGRDNHVERDLARYIEYLDDCSGRSHRPEHIDYEQFLAFLDTEHYLRLKGKDTWSDEGNESQLMLRRGIARVLIDRSPDRSPPLYQDFARRLDTTDMIFTFNYDTLLEQALDDVGVAYRLFPDRFTEIDWSSATTDNSLKEVVVIKLHGSIDWFDRAVYERHQADANRSPTPYTVKHPLFGNNPLATAVPLTDGPRPDGDPLAKIFRVKDVKPILDRGFWECCPLILAPSHTKLLYAQPLKEFWWGLQRMGGLNLGLSVVGYSLPLYDDYARQALYHVFSNYTGYEPDYEYEGRRKRPIRILDNRPSTDSGADIRASYRFADWSRTELRLDGFSPQSLEWLME